MNGVELIENKPAPAKVLLSSSRDEFAKRRWILITNLPDGVDVEGLKQNFLHGYDVVDGRIEKNSGFFLLKTPDQAIGAVNSLNGQSYLGFVVGLSLAPPDSLLFVGNMPFDFTEEQFRNLMSPFGPIERLLLVRSDMTGESKGYGFVDYINRDCALQAKQQLMTSGSKYVGGRILRIDFAEPNLLTYEDLHSKTLFVDRLPRDFDNGELLRQLFSQSGTVTYSQVAVNPQTGTCRGFAFVDYMTAEETERGQKAHNGALIEGSNIRVAYGTPGRTGASILGNQYSVNNMGGPRGPFGFRPRAPQPQVPQSEDMMGGRGPRPLMAPRPLMGSELFQQIPRAPRPLMRAGPPVPRPLLGGPRGPLYTPGGARDPIQGAAPRPLLGWLQGSRPVVGRHQGPRGFGVMVPGAPSAPGSLAPRGGFVQPRPLMDFLGQYNGTPAMHQDQGVAIVNEPISNPAKESLVSGGISTSANPAVFGQNVPQVVQQQEVLVPHAPQQRMSAPSQPHGLATGSPQLYAPPFHQPSAVPQPLMQQFNPSPLPNTGNQMAPQSVPAVIGYSNSMGGNQTPPSIVPQPQPSTILPAQQAHSNQVMYAPPANGAPAKVSHDQPQYQPGTVPTSSVPVAGTDPGTTQYTVPGMTQMLQYSGVGQAFGQEQSASVQPTQVQSSQPCVGPVLGPQTQLYHWYQAAASVTPVSAAGSGIISAQPTQHNPLQVGGGHWPQVEAVSVPSAMPIQSTGAGAQYQQPQQFQQQQQQQQQTQPSAQPSIQSAESLVYYQQPQHVQYAGVVDPSLASQQIYPSAASLSSEQSAFPAASVAPVVPQHSAAPVVYNTQQASQLVPPSGQQVNQKRSAEVEVPQYLNPGLPGYYDTSKRPRF